MNYGYGQCYDQTGLWSNQLQTTAEVQSHHKVLSDDEVILASSCPKKRAGRKKFKETRHPVYRGVRQRNGNRWVCELRTPNNKSRIWLGTYPTPEMAARAHDVAALALRGRMACLNFADSAWRLPVPASSATQDIQQAAAEAAEAFRPQESEVTVESSVRGNFDEISTAEIPVKSNASTNEEASSSNNTGGGVYMDEEAMFDMPGLLANMAEGLLLPPPYTPFDDCTRKVLESSMKECGQPLDFGSPAQLIRQLQNSLSLNSR
uniref:Integrase-type DNA-binding protein n=1 Tax=Sesuvium portulacastrum TaxID=221166 RepID=A0A2I7ZAN6_SESPO|nr:integrase-type DNA-binding protein [Sesuvium portulacastrum]